MSVPSCLGKGGRTGRVPVRIQRRQHPLQARSEVGLARRTRLDLRLQVAARDQLQRLDHGDGRLQVGPAADHAVIAQQIGVDGGPQLPGQQAGQQAGARRHVAGDRNPCAEQPAQRRLRHLQWRAQQGAGAGDRLVGVDAAAHVRAPPHHLRMQAGFDRRRTRAVELVQVLGADDADILGLHAQVVDRRRGDRETLGIDTQGDIAAGASQIAAARQFDAQRDHALALFMGKHAQRPPGRERTWRD
ncbi:hypothetical protein XAC2852_880018 [Xanthomonas citri pv. citri]|nr:hypothetical protein XAC2852_880018 [Xanthomonas citri pv. citri]